MNSKKLLLRRPPSQMHDGCRTFRHREQWFRVDVILSKPSLVVDLWIKRKEEIMMRKSYLSLALGFVVASHQASAFTSFLQQQSQAAQQNTQNEAMSTALFMGRAAAVRAATKSKTDAKKAKTNAVFGKKIIMAVKAGGSPDPVANRQLGEIIKQAKANSVPVDVSIGGC